MKARRSKRKLLLRVFLSLSLVACLGLAGAGFLWKTGRLEPWLKARVVETYLRSVAPLLPFEIESIQVKKTWRGILNGSIAELSIVLKGHGYRARLKGPAEIHRGLGTLLKVRYQPQATFEELSTGTSSTPLELTLETEISNALTEISNIRVTGRGDPDFTWKRFGLLAEKPELALAWDQENAKFIATLKLQALSWEAPLPPATQSIRAERIELSLETIMGLFPLHWVPPLNTRLTIKGVEALWGDRYYDLPLETLPFLAEIFPDQLKTRIGPPKKPWLSATLSPPSSPSSRTWNITWDSARIPAAELFNSLLTAAPTETRALQDYEMNEGTLESKGAAQFERGALRISPQSQFNLRDLHFRWPDKGLSLKGIDARIHAAEDPQEGPLAQGSTSIQRIAFRRLRGSLAKTSLSLRTLTGGKLGLRIGQSAELPLTVPGLPFRVGAIEGSLDNPFATEAATPLDFEFRVPMELGKTDALKVARLFCIPTPSWPASILSLQLSRVNFSRDMLEPVGKIRLDLLGGSVEIAEMGAFDILSEVPEVDFNIEASGIQLSEVGSWLNMGEMDGAISAYAHNVTFQSWLPTRYDLRAEIKPYRGRDIIFSPEAMKNVVKLFAGEDINHLPGVADWLAFGWPSRVLGGYDVDYAGFSMVSRDGSILLETLDPERIVQREQKHFILYGTRFKMPLRTARYPLVADATSMSNFVRHMVFQLNEIRKGMNSSKPNKEIKNDSDPDPCFPAD